MDIKERRKFALLKVKEKLGTWYAYLQITSTTSRISDLYSRGVIIEDKYVKSRGISKGGVK